MNFIEKCWMTALEIKERLSTYKKETSGKESLPVQDVELNPAWPFPKYRPNSESDINNED